MRDVRIKIDVKLPFDNEIQFADACTVIADKLQAMATETLREGDHERFIDHEYPLMHIEEADEQIGTLKVTRSKKR